MKENMLTLRVPVELIDRLGELVPLVETDADVVAMIGGASRSSVVRLALVEGMRVLERRYAKRPGGHRPKHR